MTPNGTHLTQITHLDGSAANAADWSPDGRRIVFGLGDENGSSIAVVKADGRDLRVLPRLSPAGGAADQPS